MTRQAHHSNISNCILDYSNYLLAVLLVALCVQDTSMEVTKTTETIFYILNLQ